MLKHKISKFMLAAATVFGLWSCESLVSGLEKDPYSPVDAPAELMIPGAQLANALVQEGELARLMGMWSGYFTGSDRQYISLWQYASNAGDFDSPWENLYQGAIAQAQLIQQKAARENNLQMRGIAKVMEAHALGTAAMLWGDVPYAEINDFEKFPNPKFDAQADVYAAVQRILSEAIVDLKGQGRFVNKELDIYYQTDAGKWTALAHTLKARFYMHTREYTNAYNAASKGITTGGSMMTPHGIALGEANIYWYFLDWERYGYMTTDGAHIVSLMNPDSANTSYRGNAKTDEMKRFNYYFMSDGFEPNYADGIFARDADYALVTHEENLLILAEAGARTQGEAVGLKHLNELRALGPSGAVMEPYVATDFASGGMENTDGLTSAKALLREILEERYVTLFGTLEGCYDVRRTQKEADVRVKVMPNIGSNIPQRAIYSQKEINANPNAPNPVPSLFDPTPINR